MNDEPQELADYILAEDLQAEIVARGAHMPTVDAAAAAMRVAPEQIFKSEECYMKNRQPTTGQSVPSTGFPLSVGRFSLSTREG